MPLELFYLNVSNGETNCTCDSGKIPQEMATVDKAVQGVDSKKARTVKFPVLAFYNEF